MMGIESTVGSIMSIQTKLVGNNQFIRFGNSIFCVFQRTSWGNEGDVSKLECPAEKKKHPTNSLALRIVHLKIF